MATTTNKKNSKKAAKPASRKKARNQKPDKGVSSDSGNKRGSSVVMDGIETSINKETFFPTFLYYTDFPDGKRISTELETHIRKLRAEDPAGIVKSNVHTLGAWHSIDDLNRREEFAELAKKIVRCANIVFRDLGYVSNSRPAISSMWANISPRYAFNRVHTHPGSAWSGVYYVRAPENSGNLYFQDPRPQAQVYNIRFENPESRKPGVWSEVFYEPIVGRLILFPAWLQHEVQPNLSELEGEEGERISISFNIHQSIPESEGINQ